jgi:putative ABC transport system permease protein
MSDEELGRDEGWRRYLRFWGPNISADVDEEIAFHVDGLIAHYIASGMAPEDARRLAVERFGDTRKIARTMRTLANQRETAMRRTEWIDSFRRDFLFALRQLRKRPGFTLVALATLALGIGANTAIFSAVNAVLLRPLPVRDLDRIVAVQGNMPGLGLMGYPLDPNETAEASTRTDVFVAAGGYQPANPILTGTGEPRRLVGARTAGRFFDVFGVAPYLGRFYRPDESENDQHRVLVLSYDFWQELGADRAIVGRKLQVNAATYEVVGVMQPGFRYPRGVQTWQPFPFIGDAKVNNGRLSMHTVARLRDGVTLPQLEPALDGILRKFFTPDTTRSYYLTAHPFVEVLAGQLRPTLLALLGAVGFVLLIACANVASLQLVHGSARSKEMAIRAALGAERRTIIRQLLVENVVLSIGGGLLGVGVGVLILRLLTIAGAARLPALETIRLDGLVLGFTAVATILSGILFGILPALRAGRVDLQGTLKDGARSLSLTGHRSRFLQAGVVVQVALTLVLLVGAGLMIRSLRELLSQDPGFKPERVATMRVAISGPRARQDPLTIFFTQMLERLSATPGLGVVGMVSELPFSESSNSSPFRIKGRVEDPNGPRLHSNMHNVGGAYFQSMGIPLIRGRMFDATDTFKSQPVVIIDEQLAKQFFPNEDPIGKVIVQGPEAMIVGIVGTVSQAQLGEPAKATTYYPYTQHPWYNSMYLTVRTTLPMASVLPMVRNGVASVEPTVPVYEGRMLDELIGISLAPQRLAMTVLIGLAALSLGLAVFGLYGVISYAVSQRTTEFGIRVALGAQPGDVRRMVIAQGVALAVCGVVAGLVSAFVATQALSKLLYGVSPRDPLTFVVAPVILAAVAIVASYLPAHRATRVSPLEVLRS